MLTLKELAGDTTPVKPMQESIRRVYDSMALLEVLSLVNYNIVGYAQVGDTARDVVERFIGTKPRERVKGAPPTRWAGGEAPLWANHERAIILWCIVKNYAQRFDFFLARCLTDLTIWLYPWETLQRFPKIMRAIEYHAAHRSHFAKQRRGRSGAEVLINSMSRMTKSLTGVSNG